MGLSELTWNRTIDYRIRGNDSMSNITGLGSSHMYEYDVKSRKVLSRDGERDAFVDFYNHAATDEQLSTLNGWDWGSRGCIESQVNMLLDGVFNPVAPLNIDPDVKVINIKIDINETGDYIISVDNGKGEKTLCTMKTGLVLHKSDLDKLANGFQTEDHKDYNPADNSINLAIGDSYSSGKYSLDIFRDRIGGRGATTKEEEEELLNQTIALTALIDFADQQVSSEYIREEDTPFLLAFLKRLGVDISKDFTINKTKCHIVDGRIREVGNVNGTPLSVYKEAFERHVMYNNMSLTKNSL